MTGPGEDQVSVESYAVARGSVYQKSILSSKEEKGGSKRTNPRDYYGLQKMRSGDSVIRLEYQYAGQEILGEPTDEVLVEGSSSFLFGILTRLMTWSCPADKT